MYSFFFLNNKLKFKIFLYFRREFIFCDSAAFVYDILILRCSKWPLKRTTSYYEKTGNRTQIIVSNFSCSRAWKTNAKQNTLRHDYALTLQQHCRRIGFRRVLFVLHRHWIVILFRCFCSLIEFAIAIVRENLGRHSLARDENRNE